MNTLSRVSLLVVSSLIVGVTMFTPALARDGNDDRCAGSRDVKLVNGKIHTLDARNSIVSSVTIKNGKFAVVGDEGQSDGGPCMQVINLGGRTAVPGLVDNHNHFLLLGLRPGHDTRLETATSIADVQAAIRARTKTVTAGQWITAMGGWTPAQFAENRLPRLQNWMPPRPTIRCSCSIRSPAPRRPIRREGPSSPAKASRSMQPAISPRLGPRSPP